MRKLTLTIAAAALMIGASAGGAQAVMPHTVMPHTVMPHIEAPAQHWYDHGVSPAIAGITAGDNHTASVTIAGPGSVYTVVNFHYDVEWAGSFWGINPDYFEWNTKPGENLDAICWDFQTSATTYAGNICYGEGTSTESSTTYNDVPSPGSWTPGNQHPGTYYRSDGFTPHLRARIYGMGNEHGTRRDGLVLAN
jgi:hypothetical protein